MSEQIKKTDVIEDGIFKSLIEDLERSEKALKDFDEQLIATAKRLKTEVPKSTDASISSMEKLAAIEKKLDADVEKKKQNQKQLSTLQKEKLKLDQQVEKAVAQKILVRSKENKAIQELRLEKNKENKAIRDGIKAKEREKNAYFKLSDATRAYKNESKRLGAELLQLRESGKQNTKEYRELAKTYNTVTKNAQRGDAQLKKLDKTVGDNFRKVGAYENATRKLSSALGALGIAFGISTVVRSVGSTLTEFDEKLADIQKTTGLTKDATKELSMELFKIDTRSSITELQGLASAAGRLGIEGEESILGFVRAADKMFVALGDDLDGTAEEIATNIGKIADQFGLIEKYGYEGGLERVGSVINELAATTKAGASQIFDFTQRLAGVATQAGISAPDVAALGALFDDAGQSMEVAGSTLSKLLPALASDQERFAEIAGVTAEEFKLMLQNSPIDALKAVAQGAQSSEKGLEGLNETLENFGVYSARAAGIVGVLANSTEKFEKIQKTANDALEENTSISDENEVKQATLSAQVERLSNKWQEFIISADSATGITGKLSAAIGFIADNLSTIIGTLARVGAMWLLYTQRARIAAASNFLFNGGLKTMITSIPKMITGLRGASLSFRTLGAAMKSIPFVAIIAGLVELTSYLWSATEATDANTDAQNEANEAYERGNKLRADRTNIGKNLETQLKNINNLSQAELKILKQNVEARKSQAEANALSLKTAQDRLKADQKDFDNMKAGTTTVDGFRKNMFSLTDSKKNYNDEINKGVFALEEEQRILKQSEEQLILINSLIKDDEKIRAKTTATTSKQNKALEKQLKAYQSLIDLEDDLWFRNLSDEDQEVVKRMQQLDDEMAKIEADTMMRADEREALRKALIADSEKDIQAIRDKFEQERKDKEIKAEEERIAREKEAVTKHVEALEEQADLAFQIRQNEIYKQNLNEKDHQSAMLENEKSYLEELIKIRKENGLETIDLENQLAELNRKNTKLTIASITNQVNETSKVLKTMLEESIDRAIESENRLMDNSQKMIDSLRQAATEGNLQAKESILAEEKAIEESQKRIAKHQKNKQRMEFISTGINTFNSSVQGGKTGLEALGETAVTMSGLAGMLAGLLPSFDVGADRLTGDGRGVDGKGGFLAINHPNERILTADHNKRIGFDMRNNDIVDVVDFYKKGLLVPRDEVAVVSQQVDHSAVLERIDKGFSKINNWNISTEELFGNISVLIEKSKNGDIHRYRRNYKA